MCSLFNALYIKILAPHKRNIFTSCNAERKYETLDNLFIEGGWGYFYVKEKEHLVPVNNSFFIPYTCVPGSAREFEYKLREGEGILEK